MAGWPKTIFVKGIGISIGSWEELDELIQRYGVEGPVVIQGSASQPPPKTDRTNGSGVLAPLDRSLLENFVASGIRGVLSNQLGPALGTGGRGIRPALDAWARRIGLVTQDGVSAFETVKRLEGRGFRLTPVYLDAARSMLA